MPTYLHTMYRITDAGASRAFYEALGLEFRRDMDIVRNGEREATNYFLGFPGQDEELELTLNHDGRTYDQGPATATSRSASTTSMARSLGSPSRASNRREPPYQVREGGSWLCFVRDPDGYRIEVIGS